MILIKNDVDLINANDCLKIDLNGLPLELTTCGSNKTKTALFQ